jgi:tRNA nucleotidyltransferase/poly(A) polymerase
MQVISKVLSFIADQNIDAYFVGGLVRDELLGRPVKRDIDLAIDGEAIELARAFADAHGGAFYPMDEEHNVARVMWGDPSVDFAQLRGDIRGDLSSRDFTINAIARRLGSNERIDPFDGERDLRDKKIRAVSDDVFKNDPVRLLRAVRIAGDLIYSDGTPSS